jgi:hypothetical protein
MLSAESLVAKSKYAGNLYLQFEREESWTRPGVRGLAINPRMPQTVVGGATSIAGP